MQRTESPAMTRTYAANYDPIQPPTRAPDNLGQESGNEGSRLAPSQGTGSRSVWAVAGTYQGANRRCEWPGRELGVRAPESDETALSEAEAMHLVRVMLA